MHAPCTTTHSRYEDKPLGIRGEYPFYSSLRITWYGLRHSTPKLYGSGQKCKESFVFILMIKQSAYFRREWYGLQVKYSSRVFINARQIHDVQEFPLRDFVDVRTVRIVPAITTVVFHQTCLAVDANVWDKLITWNSCGVYFISCFILRVILSWASRKMVEPITRPV